MENTLPNTLEAAHGMIRRLEFALACRTKLSPLLGLTNLQTHLAEVLIEHDIVTFRDAVAATSRASYQPSIHTLQVQVSQMRKKLRPYRVCILPVKGIGWRIAEPDKQRLRQIIAEGLPQ